MRKRNKTYMQAAYRQHYTKHGAKVLSRNRTYRKLHPSMCFQSDLKKNYGLTLDDWHRLIVAHAGRCAICDSPDKICVDHDHATGKIRGLLCHHCNTAIGLLREDPWLFAAASRYLSQTTVGEDDAD